MRTTRIAFVVGALVTGLFLGAAPSGAHFIDSSFTKWGVDDHTVKPHQKVTFFGKLSTPGHPACHMGAKIKIQQRFRKPNGRYEWQLEGFAFTDNQGEFSFTEDPQPNHGKFFARYRGSGRFGYGNGHKCGRAFSDAVRIRLAS